MSDLIQMLNHPFVETLGWSLIHFLWQGMLIATLAAVVLALLKNASASLRYFVACLAFVLMAAAPAATVWTLNSDRATASGTAANNTEVASAIAGPSGNGSVVTTDDLAATLPQTPDELPEHPADGPLTTATATETSAGTLEPWLTTLVAGWLFGVTALSLRLVLTLLQVSRLRTQITSIVPQEMTDRLAELTRRLGVSRPVRLAQSALVEVPTVIGALKPLILLPATAMTGLSAEQLDAILAHEIAHIRRHDYLVNLVQTVIETLLFYHPGVWWLSGKIRQERENCCDDIASDLCENPIRYAEALVRMEELRTPAGGLALAATGGSLRSRIRRLLGPTSHESSTSWWVGGLVSLLIVFGFVVTLGSLSTQSQAEEPVRVQPTEASTDAQTPPDKEETKDEVEPLTPASIADAMEESMKQYATIDFSADHLKSDGSESERSKPTGESREVEATIRYRADGNRFLAERNAIGGSDGTWIEGFDGKAHYHTDRGLLILGEESLLGQALSPLNLLFSHNGRPTETLRFLRNDNAKIVAEINIEGTTCQVIEIPFSREDRSWTYRITVAPERSSLPLLISRSEKGETTIRHTLSQLVPTAGGWYAKRVATTRYSEGKVSRDRQIQITRFSTRPDVSPAAFAPPIVLGTNVLDRRVGYGWHEDPWWSDLKPWLQQEYGWPRPDLFELHSVCHYGDCPLESKPAPPVEPAEWLAPDPGGWDRPERKLTLLYFYGGRLITPTPKWAAAIDELHRRYRQFGFEVIGLAGATGTPALPRQAAEEMSLSFPVCIDQKSDTGYGNTFLAYGLESYHGMFFVDHEGLVRPCSYGDQSKVTVGGKEFTISHMEAKVIDLLKKAGVENVEPQVLPSDIFDIKTHNAVLAEWRRLRKAAPKDASVHGRITFNGAPVAGASIKLQPSMRIMSSNTGHGFMLFPDRAATITVPTNPDGAYEITNLTKGEYKFTCSAKGLKTRNRTILIGADLPKVNVDVTLSEK
jgi:beta-lactamase regulating signal transducer with metallopeptidase domain